jgi:hypothetical protein
MARSSGTGNTLDCTFVINSGDNGYAGEKESWTATEGDLTFSK